ncbi:hypothetical protein G9A89_011831 [Geosiphon pyriformis]|nr:hypothetical protein G9A89_011831 [Geosiphon pyriformis]
MSIFIDQSTVEINIETLIAVPNSESVPKSKPIHLSTTDAVINLSVSSVSSSNLSTTATSDLLTTTATNNLSTPTNPNTTPKLTTQWNPKTENDLTELKISDGSPSTDLQFFTATIWIMPAEFSLLVTPEDTSTNNLAFAQKQLLTSNIPFATITEDELLTAIFPFKFKKTTIIPLFSGATLEAKPITMMYTNAKVERQSIKLILDSVDRAASARIITADEATKTLIGKIDDFPFKVNGIMTPIKVLELQLTYQGRHIHVPAMSYQVSWANADHNKLPLILSWNDNPKEKQKEELIWKTDNLTWTDNEQEEPLSLYVSIATRNCCQWAHVVATMRNTTPQQSSTVVHAYLNTLDDQKGKENGITNLVSLVGRLY